MPTIIHFEDVCASLHPEGFGRSQRGSRPPISKLLIMTADGKTDAVPVLDKEKIVGIVTRSDLVAALARSAARA